VHGPLTHPHMPYRLFLTRRWTPKDILIIGYELATLDVDAFIKIVTTAVTEVPQKHLLLFLFILDACLKRQTVSTRTACRDALASLLRHTGCRVDDVHGYEIHKLCVHWVERGLLPAATVFPSAKLVLGTWSTHACEHDGCDARFVGKTQRDVHMDLHFDERAARLDFVDCATTAPAPTGTSTWLLDNDGVSHAVPVQGYFHARREVAETSRLRGLARRQGSPVPCRRVAAVCTSCDVCGDGLPEKRFDDALREWVYDDCILFVSYARHASCHAECAPT